MADLEAERLDGLNYARSLDFTDSQYEEALKMIDSPRDRNQLLVTLLDICDRQNVDKESTSTSSSCYSSIASFPCSSNQSLESIQQSPVSLRKIYIDGANIARSHGKNGSFSWIGIKICVDWFMNRGHKVKVFIPVDRCQQADLSILNYLQKNDVLVETPVGCNDDLFVIEAARQNNGVIVSNDLFREEKRLNVLQKFIHLNRLPYVFVDDLFMPAKDPIGRSGPSLEEFLQEYPEQNTFTPNRQVRTKFNQRYQRYGSLKNQSSLQQCSNIHHRISLQSTTSCPKEQSRIISNDIRRQLSAGQPSNHHPHSHNYKNQLDRSMSAAFTGVSSVLNNSKEGNSSSSLARVQKNQALCRTRSHNI